MVMVFMRYFILDTSLKIHSIESVAYPSNFGSEKSQFSYRKILSPAPKCFLFILRAKYYFLDSLLKRVPHPFPSYDLSLLLLQFLFCISKELI